VCRRGGYGGDGGRAGFAIRRKPMRLRDAMRDLMNRPLISSRTTGSMMGLTGQTAGPALVAGRGRKIKDDKTKIERKTQVGRMGEAVSKSAAWSPNQDDGNVAVDPDHHQLE